MNVHVNRGRLRIEIAIRGLDQAALAEAAHISASTLSHACHGHRIAERTLLKVVRALHSFPVIVDRGLLEEDAAA